jgi:putative ABC transport system substrate-binding protein
MLFVPDPGGMGLALSLAHAGGNLTGVATLVPRKFHCEGSWHSSRVLATGEALGSFHQSIKRDPSAAIPREAPPAAAALGFQPDVIEVHETGESFLTLEFRLQKREAAGQGMLAISLIAFRFPDTRGSTL